MFESTEDLPIILTHCNGFDKGNALHVCSPCQVLLDTKPIPGDAQSFLGLLHGRKLLHYTYYYDIVGKSTNLKSLPGKVIILWGMANCSDRN